MKKLGQHKEVTAVAIGELIAAALTVLVYFLVSLIFDVSFTWRVPLGALLGALVITLNFLFMSLSINKRVDEFVKIRGSVEMSEEEAEKFAAEHSVRIQNILKTSFIVRTLTMLLTLILAFVLDCFDPIATIVPILAYRIVIMFSTKIIEKLFPVPIAAEGEAADNVNEKEN